MMPIIGPAPRHQGLWFAFGHAHHGLTLGPTTGRLIAEMVTGETPFLDPTAFSATRFRGLPPPPEGDPYIGSFPSFRGGGGGQRRLSIGSCDNLYRTLCREAACHPYWLSYLWCAVTGPLDGGV